MVFSSVCSLKSIFGVSYIERRQAISVVVPALQRPRQLPFVSSTELETLQMMSLGDWKIHKPSRSKAISIPIRQHMNPNNKPSVIIMLRSHFRCQLNRHIRNSGCPLQNLGLRLQANPQNCKETLEYWIAQTKKGRAVGGCYRRCSSRALPKRSILDAPRPKIWESWPTDCGRSTTRC